MVLLIIALLLIIMILLGIIISSHQADEVEEQMRNYKEPVSEADKKEGLEALGKIRNYIEELDSYRNLGIISDEQYEHEKREACRLINELQERYKLYEQ